MCFLLVKKHSHFRFVWRRNVFFLICGSQTTTRNPHELQELTAKKTMVICVWEVIQTDKSLTLLEGGPGRSRFDFNPWVKGLRKLVGPNPGEIIQFDDIIFFRWGWKLKPPTRKFSPSSKRSLKITKNCQVAVFWIKKVDDVIIRTNITRSNPMSFFFFFFGWEDWNVATLGRGANCGFLGKWILGCFNRLWRNQAHKVNGVSWFP